MVQLCSSRFLMLAAGTTAFRAFAEELVIDGGEFLSFVLLIILACDRNGFFKPDFDKVAIDGIV